MNIRLIQLFYTNSRFYKNKTNPPIVSESLLDSAPYFQAHTHQNLALDRSNSALCGICPNPHKSIELQFSKNYLTTKDPFLVRIQKIQKFRKIYSPDPDSGSGIPEI